jgi:hypothetical protein
MKKVQFILCCVFFAALAMTGVADVPRLRIEHAAILKVNKEIGFYEVVEEVVENKKELLALRKLCQDANLPKVFGGSQVLVMKLYSEGRPRLWLPVKNNRVRIPVDKGEEFEISIEQFRKVWGRIGTIAKEE